MSDVDNVITAPSSEAVASEPTAAPQTPVQDFVEYEAAGKTVREPMDMVKKRASMGYHYAQQMESLKKEQGSVQEALQRAQALEAKWKPFDDYASKNPAWHDHLQKSWQERDFLQSQNLDPALKNQLNGINTTVSELQNWVNQSKAQAEDSKLNEVIGTVKKEFPFVNFDEADELGRSLEWRVLKHAGENGINSFRAAFLDLHQPQLALRIKDQTKREIQEEQKKLRENGFIGRQPTSVSKSTVAQNVGSRTWEDLAAEAVADLSAGKYTKQA